jgi:hypothetical protein
MFADPLTERLAAFVGDICIAPFPSMLRWLR